MFPAEGVRPTETPLGIVRPCSSLNQLCKRSWNPHDDLSSIVKLHLRASTNLVFTPTLFLWFPNRRAVSNLSPKTNGILIASKMSHVRGLTTVNQALRRVFIAPRALTCEPCSPVQIPLRIRQSLQIRNYMKGPSPRNAADALQTGDPRPARMTPNSGIVRDEAINKRYVQIVNEEGKLDEPITLRYALQSIDRDTDWLLQVAPSGELGLPICKVVNKREMRDKLKEKEKAAKKLQSENKVKQVEMNWAIGSNDMAHRLSQIKGFLEKGRKVEIVLAPKKRGRKATLEEGSAVIKAIKDMLEEANAQEVKPMEGKVLAQAIITAKQKK